MVLEIHWTLSTPLSSCIHSLYIAFAKTHCCAQKRYPAWMHYWETVGEQLLILGSDKESWAVWNLKKKEAGERVMERIDQEGHQLPKKGQTMSRMPSASPLFTDTNDIGSLRWRGVSVEGRSGLWLGQRKKKTAVWGKWALGWFEITTLWSWPLHVNSTSGLIRRYANAIIR